jgi:hypothetical protein
MKIKDEEELARLMSRAFRTYSNQVENGAVAPFKPFLEGQSAVTVNIHLNDDGSIGVEAIPIPNVSIPIQVETIGSTITRESYAADRQYGLREEEVT